VARKLIFDPSIPADLANAVTYYDSISAKLADRFRANVDRRLHDIAAHPESFPADVPPIRFAKIERFPYLIFFKAYENHVSVIAVLHGSSNPERWRNR